MRSIRTVTPVAATLAMALILAACTQSAGISPSASASDAPVSPSAPAPSDSPSEEPSDSPSESPTPNPSEEATDEHELPIIGRVTEPTVVRMHPMADAPILEGDSFALGTMIEINLEVDDLLTVTMGPLVNEGQSWYEIASVDGDDVNFAFGWIPGDAFEHDADLTEPAPVIETVHGEGDGGSVSSDVIVGTPVSVRYAALPMADADECHIEVRVTNADGTTAEVLTETLTEIRIEEVTPFQFPGLFQHEAGEVTLEVDTDCSFAASLAHPPG